MRSYPKAVTSQRDVEHVLPNCITLSEKEFALSRWRVGNVPRVAERVARTYVKFAVKVTAGSIRCSGLFANRLAARRDDVCRL